TGTMYFVARTKETDAYVQRLHAVDIVTGQERSNSPVIITASVPGNAPESIPGPNGPIVPFDPKMQNQRAGLGLVNGVVLVAWSSHEDLPPYHGWVMAFDAATLANVGAFSSSPDYAAFGTGNGIWQGGRAPTIDQDGFAYYTTGNGPWDGQRNFGD